MYSSFRGDSSRKAAARACSGLVALFAAGALLLATVAVGSESGSAATQGGASARATQAANPCDGRKQYFIYYATHARPHPFWTPLLKGAVEGSTAACMRQKWTQSPGAFDFAETVNRIRVATAERPDVLVVSMADPKAAESAVRDAISKGITVINVNANDTRPIEVQPKYLGYVGIYDENDTGVMAAKQMLAFKKVTFALVGNNAPGAINVEKRAKGFLETMKAAGVKTAVIDTQFNTPQVMETYLVAHPDVDGFYTMGTGPTGAPTARAVIAKLGRADKIALIGGDSTLDDLKAIKDGTQVAGIVQQQYLQGYFPPIIARLYFETGMAPLVVSTGPGAINKKGIDQAIKLATWGLR